MKLADGDDVRTACRSVGVSDATHYNWRRRFGGMGKPQLSELRGLEKESPRLKTIVAELDPDSEARRPPPARGACRTIPKGSLNHLKPGVPLTGR